jgi:hypothetical protein
MNTNLNKLKIMQKYFLTFNQDYADEFNVPAFSVMNQEEYNKFLENEMGEINEDYDKKLKEYEKKRNEYYKFIKESTQRATDFGRNSNEYIKWFKENRVDFNHNTDMPSKGISYLVAYLGNEGDGFEKNYVGLSTGKDFVDKGYVKVHEISDEIYNFLKSIDIGYFSLCNIFEVEKPY